MKTYRWQPLAIILGCLIVAEGLLPWCLIWLSDQFYFEITAKQTWAVFGGPAIVALAAMAGTLLWPRAVARRHPSRNAWR